MKWTWVYLIGYFILISGLLAGIGVPLVLIAVVTTIGISVMFIVTSSGCKGSLHIDQK